MKRVLILAMLGLIMVPLGAGCFGLADQTTVNMVNNTQYPVSIRLYYDDDQNLPQSLIELDGTEMRFTVASGQTYTFSRTCEDLQAIFIKDADMIIAPGISPEANTRVYREPGDFGCGHTLTFTFTQNALGTNLSISYAHQK